MNHWDGARMHPDALAAADLAVKEWEEVESVDVVDVRGRPLIRLGVKPWWPFLHPILASQLLRKVKYATVRWNASVRFRLIGLEP